MAVPMTAEKANAIYDILIRHAGAFESWTREDFVDHQTRGTTDEYRFQGGLGFGGKFWNCNGRWYVTAYPETVAAMPDVQELIDATTAALVALKAMPSQ